MEIFEILQKVPVNVGILILCFYIVNQIKNVKTYIDLKLESMRQICDERHGVKK